jgi:hypothetical protein
MDRFLESLKKAEQKIAATDHLVYVTFPLVKEKNILIQSLLSIKEIVIMCINLILQYEYLNKRIDLSSDPSQNFRIFKEECSKTYFIQERDIKEIERMFDLARSHKKSPMELIKDGKVVILSKNMEKKTFTIEDIKIFLGISKKIIEKTKKIFCK